MGQFELTSLGRHVAELQDREPQAQLDRLRGRARLLREEGAGQRARRPWLARGLALGLAAAVIAVLLLVLRRQPEPLRFAVGAAQAGAVGAWIAAPAGDALPIRFSDGSELVLAPGGRARVAAVSADGAEIALERGSLDLSVVHRDKTRWTVHVGPFQVLVVGTRFDASWDPVSERCAITLREGAITVSGPVVGEGRAVRAGERLVISPATGTLESSFINAPGDGPGQDAPAVSAPAGSAEAPAGTGEPQPASVPVASASGAQATASARAAAPPPSTWRALARGGQYKEALAAAEREGFAAICGAGSAADVYALGEAARLGGDGARAARAYGALRSRFPGTAEAAAAAFLLGRMAQDRNKDPGGAAVWFTRYLSEQPAGAFAAEAAGRLVEARDRSGDSAGARLAAERYLAAYPDGSHSEYAKSVVARGADGGAP